MATNVVNLQAIKAALLQSLADETAFQAANGPKPTYSLDGESYSWSEWRSMMLDKIKDLNILIQQEDPVWCIKSRGRP